MRYLPDINSPQDLKALRPPQLVELCQEIRQDLIERVTRTGGHIGSNLGLVEATVALHYVFDSPTDRFVFDVSHQSYVHKMLTGRYHAFMQGTCSGYTNPQESDHDSFMVGHTSTAVSLAVGLAKGRQVMGGTERIVAVLGDGSLSGGEAYEGLSNAATIAGNLIILFNDNEMSIAENHGGIYRGLAALRRTGGQSEPNLFHALGLDYMYVEEGNDVMALIRALQSVRDIDHPIVVHIHTHKGLGLEWADSEQERSHWIPPAGTQPPAEPTVTEQVAAQLLRRVQNGENLVVLNAANPGAVGFPPAKRQAMGDRFVDVGICEEHAVAMASGIAKRGAKAVWLVLSSFVQRTYDQLLQDLALNGTHAVVVVLGGGMTKSDPTHAGLYDISMIGNIPGLTCLAPCSQEAVQSALNWALDEATGPVVIRAEADLPHRKTEAIGWQALRRGGKVALLGLGGMTTVAKSASDALMKADIISTVVACDCYSGVDESMLDELLDEGVTLFVTLENGILAGGFGEKVAAYLADKDCKVLLRGAPKAFVDRRTREEQLRAYGMDDLQLVFSIVDALDK